MKYHSWLLQRFVSLPVDAEVFANDLTLKTCEVEEVVSRKIPEKVVIGKATEVGKHPEADKLFVCQVDCGSAGSYQILTGWENIVAGAYVAVAIPGCYLPVIDLQIDARKMRWLDSNGMICSKGELWINEDEEHHWIWLLAEDFDDLTDADLGTPLSAKYPWLDGFVLDVDNKTVTHRPDLTGHFGLAVEARTLYADARGTIDAWVEDFSSANFLSWILDSSLRSEWRNVEIQTDKVFAYSLLSLSAVQMQRSSFFTRLQLLDLWHTPKNNWVDFSNLFMYLTGQPVHFFDADLVQGDVIVRQAKAWEVFIDLTDGEHTLTADDIVIADSTKILALAWVIGWKSSAVHDGTKNILVEIANFDPVQVRKTGTRLGLRTDAELRFEKNINPVYSVYAVGLFRDALNYAAKDLWSTAIDGQYIWYHEGMINWLLSKKIAVDYAVVDGILYGETQSDHISYTGILDSLGFVVDGSVVSVPVWRAPSDINIQADVVEEIARHTWYDNLPFASMTQTVQRTQWVPDVAVRRDLEALSVHDLRADQLETYPWVPEKMLDAWWVDKTQLYTINNPLAPEQRYLRNDLVYNLLAYTAKNSKFFDRFGVWDFGKTRKKTTDNRLQTTDNLYAKDFVGEKSMWGYMLYAKSVKSWEDDTFLQAKSAVLHVLKQLQVAGWKLQDLNFVATDNVNYHPKKQADVVLDGKTIGFVGTVHPLHLVDNKMPQTAQVTYLWLDCSVIIWLVEKVYSNEFATLQDQIVQRDMCFVIDTPLPWSVVTDAVASISSIHNITVFDLYQGDKLPTGKKSIAFTMDIVGENMTTEQINAVMEQTVAAVEKVGGRLRE
jgi:phenylalanyl-tRNA synthetase beta chain